VLGGCCADGRRWAAMAERLGWEILKVLGQQFYEMEGKWTGIEHLQQECYLNQEVKFGYFCLLFFLQQSSYYKFFPNFMNNK